MNIVTLDVETQLGSNDVGGWKNAHKMKVAVVVIHNSIDDTYMWYSEESIRKLEIRLLKADLIVGFNIIGFDWKVIQPYSVVNLSLLPTFDILQYLTKKLGHRVSLDSVAQATLGTQKTADGLQSLKWWKAGEMKKIRDYCKQDVACTKDVYFYGKKHGEVFFLDKKTKRKKSVKVDW